MSGAARLPALFSPDGGQVLMVWLIIYCFFHLILICNHNDYNAVKMLFLLTYESLLVITEQSYI